MCSNPIETAVTKTCTSCGADLARWMPAPVAPPPLPETPGHLGPETVSTAGGEFNLGLGIAGAVGGALLGMGLMYGFYATTGLRFPLLGCGTGLLSGLAARWLFKGTDHSLGIISAGSAVLGVLGALVLMYGVDFSPLNIISIVVSASVAYKIATR